MSYWWIIALTAVFALVIILHERSIKKRFQKAQEELLENRALDKKIYRLYQDIEGMLDSFETYVSEVHDELESRREELLTMSRQATTLYMQVMAPETRFGNPPPPATAPAEQEKTRLEKPRTAPANAKDEPPEEKSKLPPRDRAELDKLTSKGQKIRFLMVRGFSLGEIARELGIGKGEIQLILDLDKDV